MSPDEAVRQFCVSIIESTASFASAYKLNLAFFEALGRHGPAVLEDVLDVIPEEIITIADAKRGDIGNSARFYAKALLEDLNFDSITVAPYMGSDSIRPFLMFSGKVAFVLARTSNPGGNDYQLLETDGVPLYHRVAADCVRLGAESPGAAGLVVGATDLDSLASLRILCPETPFLIPGVGVQGASASDVFAAAGSGPLLINSSRKIIYASTGPDFADAAATAARSLCRELAEAAGRIVS